MKRTRATSFILACLFCVCIAGAIADARLTAQQSIGLAYSKMAQAMQNWDVSAYISYIQLDYVQIDEDGSEKYHGKTGVEKALTPVWSRHAKMTLSTHIQDLTLDKGGAIVTVKQDYTYSRIKNGQPFDYDLVSVNRDYWVKVGGRWLQKRSRTISSSKTVNGQAAP